MTAPVRIFFNTRQAGPALQRGMERQGARVGETLALTALDASKEILERGREDISTAGRFGSRWTRGLHADVNAGQQRDRAGRFSGNEVRVQIWHDIPYFNVHEYGATIHGRPMLWRPLSFADVPKGMFARDYPGGLFRVDRKNGRAPLLLSRRDKQPKFFGKFSVRIPKRFHIREIAADVARKLKDFYAAHWNS